MDTDYAEATSELARHQIIQQAGTAMLAQANQLPTTVLALLDKTAVVSSIKIHSAGNSAGVRTQNRGTNKPQILLMFLS